MTQHDTTSLTCLICLDEKKLIDPDTESKKHIKTTCGHHFHTKCLDKWLETGYHCPMCRTELKEVPETESEFDPTEILERVVRLGYIPDEYREYAEELEQFLKDYNESINEPENEEILDKKSSKRKVNIKRRTVV